MSKRTAIGDDVGGRHKSHAACQIEEKSTYLKLGLKTIWTIKLQLIKSSVTIARIYCEQIVSKLGFWRMHKRNLQQPLSKFLTLTKLIY